MTQIPRASHPINSGGLVDRVWYDFLRQLVAQIGTTTNAPPQAQELAKIFPGAGITVSGNGTPEYPYIISLGAGSAAVVPNTSAGFVSDNPTLGLGVIGWETNTGRIKFGDDATDWNSLTYFDASALPYDPTTSGLTATDVQAAVDELAARPASSGVPYFVADGDTFSVPENQQALFAMTIDCEGILAVDGYLIGVD